VKIIYAGISFSCVFWEELSEDLIAACQENIEKKCTILSCRESSCSCV